VRRKEKKKKIKLLHYVGPGANWVSAGCYTVCTRKGTSERAAMIEGGEKGTKDYGVRVKKSKFAAWKRGGVTGGT